MTSGTNPVRAGIYCRLSLARYGDTTKVDDQERICRQLASQLSWQLAEDCGYPQPNGVYVDNSKSAWLIGVKRHGWDQMLADVGAGKLSALIVYHGDRLVRQPFDLELLLRLPETKGIKLASPTGTRDLGNAEDKTMLRIIAAFACQESENTSRRMKMGIERRRRNGVVNSGGRGGRLFGFKADGVTHIPDETQVVREVITRAISGEGTRHLAAELATRGVTTTAGKPMHPLAVRRMIASPRYAALMPDGKSAAAWEPVVSREDWETANAVVAGRAFLLPAGHNARKYLLSGIARCGACGAPLQVLTEHTSGKTGRRVAARYGCPRPGCRKVFRNVAHLDAYAAAAAVARLNDPRNPEANLPPTPELAGQFAALTAQRAEAEAATADPAWGEQLGLLRARLDSINQRLAELRELTAASAGAALLHRHTGITPEQFGRLPLGTRRALIAACFTVTVHPAGRRGPGFDPATVRLEG